MTERKLKGVRKRAKPAAAHSSVEPAASNSRSGFLEDMAAFARIPFMLMGAIAEGMAAMFSMGKPVDEKAARAA